MREDEGLMMTDEKELLGRKRSSESQKKKKMEKQKEEKMRED